MRFDLPSLDSLVAPSDAAGTPLLIGLDRIDEDPEQPRQEFDAEALAELAATISARGVRAPVSVRPHRQDPDRWTLNFGARRLRAARLAALTEIPAFVDRSADSFDQVIENEQREPLKPIELALFIKRQLAAGLLPGEIATRLGKSASYLTFVSALIDAPDWLLDIYRSGRCRGVTELYELRRLHAANPVAVEAAFAGAGRITRAGIEGVKSRVRADRSEPARPRKELPTVASRSALRDKAAQAMGDRAGAGMPQESTGSLLLLARHEGVEVRVVLEAAPLQPTHVFVESLTGRRRRLVRLDALTGLVLRRA